MTTWLLTGGAGYIGAHVLRSLQASGRDVVVLDDLSTGLARKVPAGAPLVQASVGDTAAVTATLRDHNVTGVVHLAAKKAVGESVERPEYYYRENVDGMLSLLEAMTETGTRCFVYSSSAAVYGTPSAEFVDEGAALAPESPYGQTKVIGEWMTRNAAVNRDLSWISLRYFNVAGAASPELGDASVFNLIPMVFRALSDGDRPQVFGDDYPTPDGSCIRDYIHVADLADAHVAAAAACEAEPVGEIYNVGRGQGVSVFEVMNVIAEVVGRDVRAQVGPRRPGDPAQLVATVDKIRAALGWRATHDLRQMVDSAWRAWDA
ncbi:MAG: UDP-glucose 4-epimerase GalE [Micrococcales bacterium]|nr:UDP-glucose 4-epimerase GalE [Micrococcales bacterium]